MYKRKKLTKAEMEFKIEFLLDELSKMEVEDFTTFELVFLRHFAEKPPTSTSGAEQKILDT